MILYGDDITGSMQRTMEETERRRHIQKAHNKEHGITPQTIRSKVKDTLHKHLRDSGYQSADDREKGILAAAEELPVYYSIMELEKEIKTLSKQMEAAAKELAFEEAAALSDKIKALRKLEIEIG